MSSMLHSAVTSSYFFLRKKKERSWKPKRTSENKLSCKNLKMRQPGMFFGVVLSDIIRLEKCCLSSLAKLFTISLPRIIVVSISFNQANTYQHVAVHTFLCPSILSCKFKTEEQVDTCKSKGWQLDRFLMCLQIFPSSSNCKHMHVYLNTWYTFMVTVYSFAYKCDGILES